MSTTLRTILLLASIVIAIWIMQKIRKNRVKREDALFWVCFAMILAVLGIFPKVSYMMARLFGIQAPSNFVFMVIIALLFEKMFTLSIQVSFLENRVEVLAAELAIRCKNIEGCIERKNNAAHVARILEQEQN